MSITVAPRQDWSIGLSVGDAWSRSIQQKKAREHEEKLHKSLAPDRAAQRDLMLARTQQMQEETRLMESEQQRRWMDSMRQMQELERRGRSDTNNTIKSILDRGVLAPEQQAKLEAYLTRRMASEVFDEETANWVGLGAGAEELAKNRYIEEHDEALNKLQNLFSKVDSDEGVPHLDTTISVFKALRDTKDIKTGRAVRDWMLQYQQEAGQTLEDINLSTKEKPTWVGLGSKEVPVTAAEVLSSVPFDNLVTDKKFVNVLLEKLQEQNTNPANSLRAIISRLAGDRIRDQVHSGMERFRAGDMPKDETDWDSMHEPANKTSSEKVIVVDEAGKRYELPASQLEQAQQQGYRLEQ